jgi:hypothetical protein
MKARLVYAVTMFAAFACGLLQQLGMSDGGTF